jgi:hypothetical protein
MHGLPLMLVLIFIWGCAVPLKQPVQIPALVPGEKKFGATPNIAGSYANEGEAFTVNGKDLGPVLLSRLLMVDNSADSVTVLQSEPEVIDMQFNKQGQSIAMRRFSLYTWKRATGKTGIFADWDSNRYGVPYYAVKGFVDIVINQSSKGFPPIGFSVAGEECLLRKAVDGSLIVIHREESGGMVLIVPYGVSGDTWCHFSPIEKSDQLLGSTPIK